MSKMFYSEEDIRNIVSKREMDSVSVTPIRHGDTDILIKVGDNGDWQRFKVEEFGRFLFPNNNVEGSEAEDGGIVIL